MQGTLHEHAYELKGGLSRTKLKLVRVRLQELWETYSLFGSVAFFFSICIYIVLRRTLVLHLLMMWLRGVVWGTHAVSTLLHRDDGPVAVMVQERSEGDITIKRIHNALEGEVMPHLPAFEAVGEVDCVATPGRSCPALDSDISSRVITSDASLEPPMGSLAVLEASIDVDPSVIDPLPLREYSSVDGIIAQGGSGAPALSEPDEAPTQGVPALLSSHAIDVLDDSEGADLLASDVVAAHSDDSVVASPEPSDQGELHVNDPPYVVETDEL